MHDLVRPDYQVVDDWDRHWMDFSRSEEHTSELQSLRHLVCRLLLEKKRNAHKADSAGFARTDHCVDSVSLAPGQGPRGAPVFDSAGPPGEMFFFNDAAPPEIYPLSLHDALPI